MSRSWSVGISIATILVVAVGCNDHASPASEPPPTAEDRGAPPGEVAPPTEEAPPGEDAAESDPTIDEPVSSEPAEFEGWEPFEVAASDAEERLRRLFSEHVAGLTPEEVDVVSLAVLLHARMDQSGLAALVEENGGTFTPPSNPPPTVDMAHARVLPDFLVAGRDRLRGDPRFGIPNPGPVAAIQDWIHGVVISSDSSGTVSLPADISRSPAPAIVVAVPIELPAQRVALVITFVEINGRLIPFRSDCFAVQTGENEVFPLVRPLL